MYVFTNSQDYNLDMRIHLFFLPIPTYGDAPPLLYSLLGIVAFFNPFYLCGNKN